MKRNSGQTFWEIFLLIKVLCPTLKTVRISPQTLSIRDLVILFLRSFTWECWLCRRPFISTSMFLKNFLSHARPADAERRFLAEKKFSLVSFDGVLSNESRRLFERVSRSKCKNSNFWEWNKSPRRTFGVISGCVPVFLYRHVTGFPEINVLYLFHNLLSPIPLAIESRWFFSWGMQLNLVNLTHSKRSFISTDLRHNLCIYWSMRLLLFTRSYIVINLQ